MLWKQAVSTFVQYKLLYYIKQKGAHYKSAMRIFNILIADHELYELQ
jgi:hypothetical protein